MFYTSQFTKWKVFSAAAMLLFVFGLTSKTWLSARREAHFKELAVTQRPFTADQLSGVAEGTEVVATGWIAGLDSAPSHRMVFYDAEVRQMHRGRHGTYTSWDDDSSQDYHPSFLLRQSQGVLTILGSDYSLEGGASEIGSPGFDTMDAPVGARRYRGGYAGQQVTAIGRVTRSGSPGVRAELVFAGTPDELASFEQRMGGSNGDFAVSMFAMAMVFLVIMLILTVPYLMFGRGNRGFDQESALNGQIMSPWPRNTQ